jgi:Sec-independent protein translocase protein TatA
MPCTGSLTLAFTLGGPELLIIAGVIVLLFGGAKMSGLMKSLGSGAAQAKKIHDEVRSDIDGVRDTIKGEVDGLLDPRSPEGSAEKDEED